MNDDRTTELREKLTERGIEYATNDHMGVCETSWNGFTVMQLTPNAKLIMVVTPKQAIAATMGGQRSTVEIAELLDEFEHECYMLRVEASETRARDDVVRESYERIRDEFAGRIAATVGNETLTVEQVEKAISDCCTYASYDGCTYYASGIRLQAIADELNREIGGTCELAYGEDDDGYDGWYCQSCGGWFDAVRRDGKLVEPMRCGCCGRRVK